MSKVTDQTSKYAAFERLTGDAMSKNKQELNTTYGAESVEREKTLYTMEDGQIEREKTLFIMVADRTIGKHRRSLQDVDEILKLNCGDSMKVELLRDRTKK